MIFENQRSSLLSISNFSSENLQKTDKCGPWSNKYGIPCNKDDIKLPKSNTSNGWFWMTDWTIDYKSPNVNKVDGWQYAKTFEDKPEMWSSEPIKGLSSIGGCVRRRIWIRIRKRKYINISPNTNPNTYVDASASSSNSNANRINNYNNSNNNNLIIMDKDKFSNNNGTDNYNVNSNEENKNNIKGKKPIQSESNNNNVSINSEVSQCLLDARNIVNEEEYSWEFISKNETDISIIENQFEKYTKAIEYLLNKNKEKNLSNSREMTMQIENYLKKAEFLKVKLSKLKENNNPLPGSNNVDINANGNSLSHSSSTESAQWEKDENVLYCNDCKGKFSLFNRRHHCRYCGKIFCSKCSNYQFKIKNNSPSLRVCKSCYINLTKDKLNAVDGNAIVIADNENENNEILNSSDDELIECPVCGKSLALYGSNQNSIEDHLKTCLENENGENKPKLGNKYELQKLDNDLGKECPICFEEFLKGQTIVRIDCLCIFHKECIEKWYDYRKVDGICPIHSLDD